MKPHHVKVGLLGARGRMGQWVARLLETEFAERAALAAEVERGGDLHALLRCDAVIDFASFEACAALAKVALAEGGALPVFVLGSTGWQPGTLAPVEELARRTPVLMSSNFSTGVLAVQHILKTAAPLLHKLGYSAVMVEKHHRHKKDAPSGTALMLNRVVEGATHEGVQTISVRAGEVIGDHELTFYGPGDRIEIGHFAQDRSIFARGAIEAALWLHRHRTRTDLQGQIIGMEPFFKEYLS